MIETLRWWLVATVIGLLAVPYAFRLFRFLPDRGYVLARVLGVLLVVYVLWMLSVLGLTRFSAGSATLLLAVMAAGAVVLAGRDREELIAHLKTHRPLVVATEVLFAAVLFGLAAFRAYAPEIDATEKLFELGLFNSVLRNGTMPAADPWYGGEPLSYYYGGYLFAALFTHLTRVPAALAFNLAVAMTGALTALGAFALGVNVTLALRRRRPRHGIGLRPAIAAGLLAVVLLLVIGNLEGVFELAAAHGWGSSEFYQRLGIGGLTGPQPSQHWYPDGHWFWWRATRLGSDWNILEFPFFSLMLGDLHAHLMVLPLSLLGLGWILNLLLGDTLPDWWTWRRSPLLVLFPALLGGMLALVNTWDLPIFLLLVLAATLALTAGRAGLTWGATARAVAFVAPVAVLAILLYVPFFKYLHSATEGPRLVELNALPEGVNGEGMVLPPHHFLIAWGPLLLIGAAGIVLQAARRRVWRAAGDAWPWAVSLALLPLLSWGGAIAVIHRGTGALLDEIRTRATWWAFGSYWLVQFALVVLVAAGIATMLVAGRRPPHPRRAGQLFVLIALTAAFGLLHGIELFYVKEPTPARTNTLFKFSYTAWLLLATAGGASAVDALLAWRPRRRAGALIPAWATAAAIVVVLALVYPITTAMNRTDGFGGTPTLDGLAFLRAASPDEYDAARWLREHLPGKPVVLEATGGDYSLAGRVSARTGLPTVIGWPFHEAQQRGARDFGAKSREVGQRVADVDTIYNTNNVDQARALLRRYNIEYVYVGQLELEKYGTGGLRKFNDLGHPLYRNASVTVWAIDGGPLLGSEK